MWHARGPVEFADPQHARSFQALFGGETKEAAE
jgi:hypothetical protein